MEIKVNFLDKLRLEAKFDDFTVIADQPIRYKGDGSAPGPFDYFLASSALCAAYFVKLYCQTRNISTDNIRLSQNNIVDPENRYKQIFKIQVELPADISDKATKAIMSSKQDGLSFFNSSFMPRDSNWKTAVVRPSCNN